MFGINGEIVNARVHNLKMELSKILHACVQNLPIRDRLWSHCVHNLPIREILDDSVYFSS